ncbi:MAG TPA: GIY-YIG nuclease family protein [Candidatus Dependentiae bacterium]|nr:GIY-YIG nuclease family protein [Candidatus Dependentiae bacterium]HRQ63005.1 GIY-YIG nuclease family protein [Candidatus Dependentiae bacterium]
MHTKLTKTLPALPGVYLFKNQQDTVIYIGKAKSLKNRVHSYFQDHNKDWKVIALRAEYADLDFIITKNEDEALLLEAQLIQEHRPKFNTLFKDGQPFVYIVFTQGDMPTIKVVRNKKEKGTYFGPFLQKIDARRVHDFLMHTFRLKLCNKTLENGCLNYHLGTCPGNCKNDFDRDAYMFRLQLAHDALKKNHQGFLHNLKTKIAEHTRKFEFEQAKRLVQYLDNIDSIFNTLDTKYHTAKYAQHIFATTTPTPYAHIDADETAYVLQALLALPHPVRTIDCFDISHFQSKYIVGSCVRFTNGKPDKNKFRRFKIQTLDTQNDYAALQEIVARRYKDSDDIPDLILIDGGKGQLHAAQQAIPYGFFASLAKREEILYSSTMKDGIHLDIQTNIGKLLIALRDYAHHFAISYHRLKRKKSILQ